VYGRHAPLRLCLSGHGVPWAVLLEWCWEETDLIRARRSSPSEMKGVLLTARTRRCTHAHCAHAPAARATAAHAAGGHPQPSSWEAFGT